VIGAGIEAQPAPGLTLVDWKEATEISELGSIDIGIMPLPDNAWARGKCGYKLIQYGACGLPVIASPVGVNSEIVLEGSTGLLATTRKEWVNALERLLTNDNLRRSLGEAGRQRIENHYSLKVQSPRLIGLLNLTLNQVCAA
jgi:glycosyltransferase involved in cell wall biosynthesis